MPQTDDVIEQSSFATGILILLLVLWTTIGYSVAQRSKFIGEGSAAAILGLGAGLIIVIAHNQMEKNVVRELLVFDSAQFFTYLLPPIIFYAGLSVMKKQFFQHFFSIMALGVLGTFLSFVILCLILVAFSQLSMLITVQDCLALGAIFAATDSVATLQILQQDKMPLLYSLVFGEGVMNDATSVVLLKTVQLLGESQDSISGADVGSIIYRFLYLFFFSFVLGVVCGLLTSYLIKKMDNLGTQQEVSLIALMAYLSYLFGEVLGLSGILTIFFCAIVISHYALQNMAIHARACAIQVFKSASYLAEGVIFIYVGMDTLDIRKWKAAQEGTSIWLVFVLLIMLSISRALIVVPVSAFHNYFSKDKLAKQDVVIIWWAGMMRGAVSVALVYYYFDPRGVSQNPHKSTVIVATLLVVLISTVILGGLTKPLLDYMLKNFSQEPFLQRASFGIPFINNKYASSSATQSQIHLAEIKPASSPEGQLESQPSPRNTEMSDVEYEERSHLISSFDNQQEIQINFDNQNEESRQLNINRQMSVPDPNTFGGKLLLLWDYFDKTIMQPIFGSEEVDSAQRGLSSSRSALSLSPAMKVMPSKRSQNIDDNSDDGVELENRQT